MSTDGRVLICLSHADDDPERVLMAYLIGVESVRAGKQVVMTLTNEGVHLAREGVAATLDVPGAPSTAKLHAEYVERGGRFFVCPIGSKLRDLQDADWLPSAEIAGVPEVFEFTAGGALVLTA